MNGFLEKYSGFKAELAAAESYESIKNIESKAAAIAEFARKNKIARDAQNEWGIFRIEIEQKKGLWLDEHFPHGSDHTSKLAQVKLASMPVNYNESANARLLNRDVELTAQVIEKIRNGTAIVTPNKVVGELRKIARQNKIQQEREAQITQQSSLEIHKGDFENVLNNVYDIDAIITDPPYPKKHIECWSRLSKYARDHLKDDGFLVAYSGQYNLPEVISRLSEHLVYVWTFCLWHKGKKQLVNHVNVMCGWKPILIFSKGRKSMRFPAYDIVTSEQMEKQLHKWQQSESGVARLVEIFTEPGQLVVDPFAGSGTFLKVANDMGRNAIGAEIN